MATSVPAEIELERKVDRNHNPNELQQTNILLVQSKPNQSRIISKYQNSTPNAVLIFIEYIRWKLNLILLFRPFACLSYIPIKHHFHQCLYRLTLSEIIFWAILIYIAYPQTLWFVQTLSYSPVVILGSDAVIGRRLLSSDSGDGDGDGGHSESGESAEIWLAIAWVLALRNTFLWNILFGFSFERMIVIHRIIGRFAAVLGVYHFWEYRNFDWFAGKCYTGSMALIPLLVILLTSLNIFRRNIFTIFSKLHWIGILMFAYYAYQHGAPWLLLPLGLTVMDVMYRWYTTFAKPVIIDDIAMLHGNVMRIVFNKTGFKYEAGQYVFVCIPAIDFTQYHPFSLSSSPHHADNLSIHIRVLGDWTAKLKTLTAHYQNNKNKADWQQLTCFVEGPYGSLQVPLHEYESIVMISGGIGITPLQSIFNELLHNISTNSNARNDEYMFSDSKVKRIHFVWSVRDPSVICEFNTRHWAGITFKDVLYFSDGDTAADTGRLPHFFSPDLLIVKNESQIVQRCEVITHFYITRVLDQDLRNEMSSQYPYLRFGRPNVEDILKQAKEEYNHNNSTQINCVSSFVTRGGPGVTVLSCGPKGMLQDVKKYATRYGIDCHAEIFEF